MSGANIANLRELLRAGITAAKTGHKEEARRLLHEVTEGEPANELAWLWLAGVAETPQDTLHLLQRVLDINPDNPQARTGLTTTRLQIGIAEAKAGRKRTARRYLVEVTRQQPDNELAWLWLGGVAETPQEAVAFLQRVLEINPDNEHARRGLQAMQLAAGIAEARAGNKLAARQHLLEATRGDLRDEAAWHWLAEVAESPGEALRCLEKVLGMNPDNEHALDAWHWYQTRVDRGAGVWQCPICLARGQALDDVCPHCGALLSLDDLDRFFGKGQLRSDKVAAALARCQGQTESFTVEYTAGLAHLNLRQLPQAISRFEAAGRLAPGYRKLAAQVASLLRRQAESERQARQKRAILVVDDSPTVRKLVTMTMEKEGFRVIPAADATEARQCLTDEIPQLILLDITMPGMDGYQLCKLIKGDRRTAQVPVVMLSGKDGFFDKIRGRMVGSTEYVTKPFKPEALVAVARKHCLRK